MKYILKLVVAAMCFFSHDAFAQNNQVVSSTARIIRVDDIAALSESAINRVPASCTGSLLSSEGHVFTSNKLVKLGDSASGVEYLVLFPIYKNDNVYAVHAYLAHSQAVSEDNHLLVLKINKENLPAPVTVSDGDVKNNLDIINIGYPDAIAKAMNFDDRGKINATLKQICNSVRLRATAELTVTNENQDNPQLMQYVTPQEDRGHVIRTTSQQGTRTEIQHQTNIDSGSEGSPLIDSASNRLVGITTSVISGLNPYNNAQSAGTVQAFSKTYNVSLGGGSIAQKVQDSKIMPYIIAAAVLLLAIIILFFVIHSRRKGASLPGGGSTISMSAASQANVAPTVVLPNVLFEFVADSGETYQVTAEMARRGSRIGRGNDCDMKFSHPTVSAKHALLCAENGRAAIADTNSSGGTSVNGIKLEPNRPKTLHRGDVIILGSCHVHVK